MTGESVANRFEQPGADNRDNKFVVGGSMESEAGANLKTKLVTVSVGDVSTGNSVWVVPGIAGTIVKTGLVIDGAIITAAAGITFEIAGTEVTGADLSIPFSGSAAGDVDQAVPTALNIITAVQPIEIVLDGASGNTVNGVVTLEILPS